MNLWSEAVSSCTLCGKGAAKWDEGKDSGIAASLGGRLSNECVDATTSSGSRESSAYVAEFFTTGVIDWTRATFLLLERAN